MYFTKMRLLGIKPIDLPIVGAKLTDRYICKNIDGLGPPAKSIVIANTLGAQGVFQEATPELREIVATVQFNPRYKLGQTTESLREELYGLLTPGHTEAIRVQINDEYTILFETNGYVSRIEPVYFSKDPTAQLTIPCDHAYFKALTEISFQPEGKLDVEIDNPGSAPTGFYFALDFTSAVTAWSITSSTNPEKKMVFNWPFQTGDRLMVDTREGQMSIRLRRASDGNEQNLINALSAPSSWLYLHRGLNKFFTSSQTFGWNIVKFTPMYQGV